ncbi:MAG: SagB/ThcOx family dehydrogenase [Planctomycetota bacterium]|nr:MAG: SagB/ThcOx family dehydrogenase [Planctomycetota bacterium]
MRRTKCISILTILILAAAIITFPAVCDESEKGKTRTLAAPKKKGTVSLEDTLSRRRSVRSYEPTKLTDEQISQLCWAAQGITGPKRGFRTAPSAGALYPIELHIITADGRFRYIPKKHALKKEQVGDKRAALMKVALNQASIGEAPCVFVMTAVYKRTEKKYRDRAKRYVHIEVGHVGQNILLQAVALGLGGVTIGAFHDAKVRKALELPDEEAPLYIIPVGKPKEETRKQENK